VISVTRKTPPSFDRREFLRAVVAVAGPVVAGCGDGDGAPSSPKSARFFPQSVASGDPRPTSVVLWTRVFDPEADGSISLELEVALDPDFSEIVEFDEATALELETDEAADHCVKVRLENLKPATTYHYRFSYVRGDERHVSRIGRTRTAPEPDADVTVRFAVVSCQDYSGKYFHVLRHVAEQELDFFVHLGDYVYETIDDPTFQDPTRERRVLFRNPEEAHPRGTDGSRLAARSFGNYCDLYRTVRTDPDLQRLHERFAMIAVWDDHEFSPTRTARTEPTRTAARTRKTSSAGAPPTARGFRTCRSTTPKRRPRRSTSRPVFPTISRSTGASSSAGISSS
jgi:alkaline phosphatase D